MTTTDAERAILLEYVHEHGGLAGLVTYAQREQAYCCEHGCGAGACEVCPCCAAGWCVMATDGLPGHPEDVDAWLEVAAEYNPVARVALEARVAQARLERGGTP